MFPKELKALNNWVCFRLIDKAPINPKTGEFAKSNDKTTWATYQEAVKSKQEHGFDGIGFMFEPPYVGIDLDDAIIDGRVNDFARSILAKCGSYAEYSPSRTGLHIIGKGTLTSPIKKPYIEVYQNQRYFTVTEKPLYPIRPLKEIDLSFLEEFRTAKTGPLDLGDKLSNIKEGSRNNDFASIAGSLRSRGYTSNDIFELLRPKASSIEFPEKELWSVCQSVGRYVPRFIPDTEEASSNSLSDFLSDSREVPYIVPGCIAENTINILAGLAESRKSWILLDLAVAIASGTLWLGSYQCEKRRVLIIDQERPKIEMQRRIKALLSGRELAFNSLEGFLTPKAGTTMRINLDQSYEKMVRLIEEVKPEVVLVDSLKAFQSGIITDNQSMQEVFEKIKHLRTKYGLTWVILHHENKGAYSRGREGLEITAENIAGASSIVEVPEGIFVAVNKDADSSYFYHVKNSYGAKQPPTIVKVQDLTEDKNKIAVVSH